MAPSIGARSGCFTTARSVGTRSGRFTTAWSLPQNSVGWNPLAPSDVRYQTSELLRFGQARPYSVASTAKDGHLLANTSQLAGF